MTRGLEKTIEENLKKSSLWINKIEQDCKNQNVFFTIRDNRIDLYHKGGKLFGFAKNEFKTHLKYASVITRKGKDYLTESELSEYKMVSDFETNYKRIKENCSKYSGIEASGVSELYHKHSYLSDSNVVVLDIEVSFESPSENKKQDRIDILLYNKKSQLLQFVEAKHFSNTEIWSNTEPKVINQIEQYESQILDNKDEILIEYVKYVRRINDIFSISLPEPKGIDDNVTLLIFGFDNDQKKGRLKKLIIENEHYVGIKIYPKGNIKKVETETLWNATVL